MTKEEAINVLNDYDINFERNTAEEIAEAHEMAIKAIRTMPSEDEKVIRIKKGTLKARTGKYVVYDVEWLKTHFNTTEAKIYGQPQPSERTEERTEMHECDCISRQAAMDALWKALHEYEDKTENQFSESKKLDVADWFQYRIFVQNMSDIDRQTILNLPSATPQPKTPQPKTGHWIGHREHCEKLGVIPSGLAVYEWCSNCGHGIDIRDWYRISHNYCPECGSYNGGTK